MSDLQRFNEFLSGIDLAKYRKRYSRIKLVELDLDRNIQALCHIYRKYWDERSSFPDFERFYRIYALELADELEEFRTQKMFSEETFYRGLPARIYRTWASLLTQIQGGYAAEEIYGRGNVEMSTDLDYRGIDMRILTQEECFNIQIKKETMSREVRAPWHITRYQEQITVITYEVPRSGPLTKTGKHSKPFNDWQTKWVGKLERLNNGFIIFTTEMFSLDHIRVP